MPTKLLNQNIQITKTQADSLIAANDLIPGQVYKITGTTGQSGLYVDLYLTALTSNKFAPEGNGLFYNPDYQGIGDYSGVEAATGILGLPTPVNVGIWTPAKEATLVNNNVVIWNGMHWPVISATAFNGTSPDINTTAYGTAFTTTNTALGYIPELDIIKYDYANDLLIYREDKRGNKIVNSFKSIDSFQFGDNTITNQIFDGRPKVYTGTTAPTTAPLLIGDTYIDTLAQKIYTATGITSSADWTILN